MFFDPTDQDALVDIASVTLGVRLLVAAGVMQCDHLPILVENRRTARTGHGVGGVEEPVFSCLHHLVSRQRNLLRRAAWMLHDDDVFVGKWVGA